MAAPGHRLHRLPVYHDIGILIAEPAPGIRGADLVHYILFQHLRHRPTPHIERRERERVNAYRCICRPFRRSAATLAIPPVSGRPVRPVGLAPQRPFPVAGLTQQVVPGDVVVVRGRKQVDQVGVRNTLGSFPSARGYRGGSGRCIGAALSLRISRRRTQARPRR